MQLRSQPGDAQDRKPEEGAGTLAEQEAGRPRKGYQMRRPAPGDATRRGPLGIKKGAGEAKSHQRLLGSSDSGQDPPQNSRGAHSGWALSLEGCLGPAPNHTHSNRGLKKQSALLEKGFLNSGLKTLAV